MNTQNRHRRLLPVVAAIALAGFASGAWAVSTWTASACGGPSDPSLVSAGNTGGCSSGGVAATVSAWSNTASSSSGHLGTTTTSTPGTFETAKLVLYGNNYGITNQNPSGSPDTETTTPNHAIDNDTNVDMVLLKFDTSIALSAFTLGYTNNDSDVTVLRYAGATTGSTTAASLMNNKSLSNLTASNGWTLVDSYSNVAGTQSIAGGASSSWWLISAYNSTIGGVKSWTDTNLDYFKLLSFAGNTVAPPPPPGVPEPGSLALAAFAAFGAFAARRRIKQVH